MMSFRIETLNDLHALVTHIIYRKCFRLRIYKRIRYRRARAYITNYYYFKYTITRITIKFLYAKTRIRVNLSVKLSKAIS